MILRYLSNYQLRDKIKIVNKTALEMKKGKMIQLFSIVEIYHNNAYTVGGDAKDMSLLK